MSLPLKTDSRRHKRYSTQDQLIALSQNHLCVLADLSESGANVRCLNGDDIPPTFSIDILMTKSMFRASIPVKIVWQKTVAASSKSVLFTKLLGVEFDNLTEENRAKINYLIHLHSEFEEKPLA